MKKTIIFVFAIAALNSAAQNVAINGTGAAPAASAMLDVSSTNSGLLIPRMTTAQRTAIASPATGLLVYDTSVPGFYYFDGVVWRPFLNNATGWMTTGNAGTNGGNTTTTGTNFLGTTDNQNIDIRTNNTYVARFSSLGEFFVGTLNTTLVGDLANVVSNASFPWALNGYSGQNGSGVYGQVTGGTTIYGGVQGEYFGTGTQGTGVRGIYGSNIGGTAFNAVTSGVQGNATSTGAYKFGVYGSGGSTTRSGGVMGYDYGLGVGALGYYSGAGVDCAVYGFGQAHTAGVAGGRTSLLGATPVFGQPNSMIGIGIYGGVMGGWVKGLVYGTNFSGEKYGVYVHGNTVTNSKYVQLNTVNGSENRVASYATTALTNELTAKGKITLVNGEAFVSLDHSFRDLCDINSLVITATPMGNCNGVYIKDITPDGFFIKELNNGVSNASVSFIVSGTLKNASPFNEQEILNASYEQNMDGVMHNENDTENPATPIWYDGQKVRYDKVDESIRAKAISENGEKNNSTARPGGNTASKNTSKSH